MWQPLWNRVNVAGGCHSGQSCETKLSFAALSHLANPWPCTSPNAADGARPPADGDTRLILSRAASNTSWLGRVEVLLGATWGTVCADVTNYDYTTPQYAGIAQVGLAMHTPCSSGLHA